MRVNTLSAAVLALASSSLVSAQTKSKCDPRKEKGCPADPAIGNSKVECDFTQGECDAIKEADGTSLTYGDDGAVFTIAKKGNAPTTETTKYLFFGKVEVELKISPGAGAITSVVLESDDLEEIDWEWLGSKPNEVQTNYFPRGGDNGVYNRGGKHAVSSADTTFHTYTVDWTPDSINWLVDGKSVRELKASDAGDMFPQTPMRVKLGTWYPSKEGGSQQGSIEWAGGPLDLSKGPYNAYYKSLKITDYAGGSTATDKKVKEYVYGDATGDMESIQVKLSDGSNDDSDSDKSSTKKDDSKTSSAAGSSSTKAAASTTEAQTTMSTAASATKSSGASQTSEAADSTSSDGAESGATGTPSPTSVPGAAPRSAAAFGSALVGAVAAAVFLF
ncbi:transglycosylase [Lecanicillium sp. MT-2017a]|nr:transglycosylase [Lecanicillium sp. MT-2017a]